MMDRRVNLAGLLGTELAPEDLVARLRSVIDPELGVNIVDLGLVYEVEASEGVARVRMTMTTPSCPIGPYLSDQVRWALLEADAVLDVTVEVTHDPPWSPDRMSDAAKAQLGWPG
ncbi:MAG TPA: metal-sulfur cluster assembly factor [Candidatus Limnocylindria bacterium]|nr:metal-sulfur cluster assembly factor [Candidatus Limnocylindria bacterium]